MAIGETTTLRVPVELRDEIARIADERSTTMVEVVTEAVQRLGRQEWWDSVHAALDGLSEQEAADYQREAAALDNAAADGLRGR